MTGESAGWGAPPKTTGIEDVMGGPRLLVLTNESELGSDAPGVHAAFDELVLGGWLSDVLIDTWKCKNGETTAQRDERLTAEFASDRYDFALMLSPRENSASPGSVDSILGGLRTRRLAIWEGDAVALHRIGRNMARWFERSDIVFSQWGQPQIGRLLDLGADEVALLPATYCHVRFAALEAAPEPADGRTDITMIASNYGSGITLHRMRGAKDRYRLALALQKSEHSFTLAGHKWPRNWAIEPIAFRHQGQLIRAGKISVNWDHGPEFADSSSNRLPISLLAGRAHITNRHPGMNWLPGEAIGLFQETSVPSIVDRAGSLLHSRERSLNAIGLEAHLWTKGRMSHRESIRYQLIRLGITVPAPPADPWDALPGPWTAKDQL